jgi:DNA-binding transcriptional MerR regulator/effector-binding domain-containing protein
VIKIGDFARLAQVSVVTLRHYDEIGLLKPVNVDRFTGYRYYSVAQLPRLNRILALKDLGFSLDQIEQVLSGDLTLEQLRGMLKLRHAEVEQRLADEQGRLTRIAARLRQIELEDTMSNYDVVLKTVPPTLIASRKITIPTNDQVPTYLGPAFDETGNYVKQGGVKWAGPCFAIWHQRPDVYENEVAEAAIPIERTLPETDRVKVYELPQTEVASVVHHGAFEDFLQGHTALLKWVEDNGYRISGPYREIYINHDSNNMNQSTTEIQYPVEKA